MYLDNNHEIPKSRQDNKISQNALLNFKILLPPPPFLKDTKSAPITIKAIPIY
jgi:hypothetical protein